MQLVLTGWTDRVKQRLEQMRRTLKVVVSVLYETIFFYSTYSYFLPCNKTFNSVHFWICTCD